MTGNHFYGVFSLQSGKISVKLEPGRIEFARQLLMGETTPGATRVARRPTHWLGYTNKSHTGLG
ncbi:MAG: hypothetical protein V7K31_04995 [Nostoc sp.]